MRRELVSRLQSALPALCEDLVFPDVAAPLIERSVLVSQEYHSILNAPQNARPVVLIDILAGKEDAAFDIFVDILRVDHPWLADDILGDGAHGDVTDSVPINRNLASAQNLENQALESSLRQSPHGSESSESRPASGAESQHGGPHRKRSMSPTASLSAHSKRIAQHHNAVNREAEVRTTGQGPLSGRDESPLIQPPLPDKEDSPNLTQGVTEEMMALVRKNHRTSRDWTSLAHALGVSRLVNKIRVKVLVFGEDLDVCVLHLLQEWVGERPKDATLSNLLSALRREGFNDVADELVEKFVT